jgi:hypothetical protein
MDHLFSLRISMVDNLATARVKQCLYIDQMACALRNENANRECSECDMI